MNNYSLPEGDCRVGQKASSQRQFVESISIRQYSCTTPGTIIILGEHSILRNHRAHILAIDKTLTENDLDVISKRIIDTVSKKTGATIRS